MIFQNLYLFKFVDKNDFSLYEVTGKMLNFLYPYPKQNLKKIDATYYFRESEIFL